jgi:hypothetical protein
MSEVQEKRLLEKLKTTLSKEKASMGVFKPQKVHYKNPHPLRATHMPNLYVGKQDCAWETTEDVGALYTKRQNTIKAFYDMLAKNAKFIENAKEGAYSDVLEAFDNKFEFMSLLPPGPNKESEHERIEYIEIVTEYMKNLLQMLKHLMQELKQMARQMHKKK